MNSFFKSEVADSVFKIEKYFNRRNYLYFQMYNGEMKKIKVEDLKNSDPLSRASKLNVTY